MILTQKSVEIRLRALEKSNVHFLFNLGKAPVLAANILQKCVKRYLFRCKLEKFRAYHHKLITDRAEKIYSVIRRHISCYSSKLKIEHERFLQYRSARLVEIRVNLSILTVAKIYRKLKLTFKSVKHRISKYKRRVKIQGNGSYLNPVLTPKSSVGNLSNLNISAQEIQEPIEVIKQDPEDYESSSSASESERVKRENYLKKLERDRIDRVHFGKISYSIREKPSSPPLLPFLYQKDIIEEISVPSNYCNITRATASRISESRPRRYSPTLFKSKTPTPRVLFKSKRIIAKPIPLYKKETFASKMNKWDAGIEEPQPLPRQMLKQRLNSKVLDYTFTHKQKINFKYAEHAFEMTRPSTIAMIKTQEKKKSRSLRPYTMMNSNIVFNHV